MATVEVPVHPRYAREIREDIEKAKLLAKCASSFREFLRVWKYLNQETGEQCTLAELWPGQEEAAEAMSVLDKLFFLKARKLGFTTIGVAYCGWVLRFRDANARVHLFSRRDDAARELLAAVKYGLDRLPPWMRLPYIESSGLKLALRATPDDRRMAKAYPTSEETAVEATCGHALVDEWARMRNPKRVWQAIEPSLAGSAHIMTTGRGPINFASEFYRKCEAGDTEFTPIFIDAMARPDRDEAWFMAKVRGSTEEHRRQEFPLNVQDAMAGGGEYQFPSDICDPAGLGIGPREPEEGHRYVKAWDIGRHGDSSVGVVLDETRDPTEVVEYVRLRHVPYPTQQKKIEAVHEKYPGPTVIEANNAGESVAENLDFAENPRTGWSLFKTTGKSKPRILEELKFALEKQELRWSAVEWPQLDSEVRGYQIPDDAIVQDSVMALSIGNHHVLTGASTQGRVLKPVGFA